MNLSLRKFLNITTGQFNFEEKKKMKASELRIGNLIIQGGIDYDSAGNKIGDQEGDEIIIVNSAVVFDIENDSVGYYGIPLTEDWLKKLGFIQSTGKHNDHHWAIRHYKNKGDVGYNEYHFQLKEELSELLPMCGAMGIYYKAENDIPFPSSKNINRTMNLEEALYNFAFHIKYVHQLQNLYSALTGEELDMKHP
jgi:hypothetical protein